MLYLVATPIGNLKDITHRAVEILQSCDYILCEDTRHSKILLDHYGIKKRLVSHHKFSEAAREDQVVQDLKQGMTIGLISDAGTPGISDPGTRIVKRCHEENISVCSIPGACAAITAITCSGLDTDRFQFFGFLPKKQSELHDVLVDLLSYPGTSICYESPKRLSDVLLAIDALDPEREIAIARELTKKFEELKRGKAKELIPESPPKGEVVLLISGQKKVQKNWEALTPEEHVKWLESTYRLSKKEAIKMAAEMRGVPKRNVYNELL